MAGLDRRHELHKACERGSLRLVRAALDICDKERSVTDANGCLPIHYACQHSHEEAVEIVKLVSETCDINAVPSCKKFNQKDPGLNWVCSHHHVRKLEDRPCGQTPLHMACRAGSKGAVSFLLSITKDGLNNLNSFSQTPLHIACIFGKVDVAKILIESGADMNHPDNVGCLPLHYAAVQSNSEIISRLAYNRICDLKHIANVVKSKFKEVIKESAAEIYGQTPLHLICISKKLQCDFIRTLLDQLPSEDIVINYYGQTLLHVACKEGCVDVVGILIRRFGNVLSDVRDSQQCIPMHYACNKHNSIELVRDLAHVSSISAISCLQRYWFSLSKHAECRKYDIAGETPLHIASLSGCVDLLDFLLKKLSYPAESLLNCQRQTLLHVACMHGQPEIVKTLLLTCGFNMCNIKDRHGRKPHFYATQYDNLRDINLPNIAHCVKKQCDFTMWPQVREQLHLACRTGIPELVRYLIKERRCSQVKINHQIAFELWPKGPEQLQNACKSGIPELVQYIYKRGHSSENRSAFSFWPEDEDELHEACKSGVPELVRYLIIERGCNFSKTIKGKLAFQLWPDKPEQFHDACKTGMPELVQYVYENRMCDIAHKDKDGRTAFQLWPEEQFELHKACKSGIPGLVNYLLKNRDCDINLKDPKGI